MIPQTIKKLADNLFFNGNKIFINDDFNARIFRNETGILYTDINNIILDDVNFDKGDPETIIHVKYMAWCSRFKQRKAIKHDIGKQFTSAA